MGLTHKTTYIQHVLLQYLVFNDSNFELNKLIQNIIRMVEKSIVYGHHERIGYFNILYPIRMTFQVHIVCVCT